MNAVPLGIYEKALSNHLSWDEKFSLVRESGFDCLEMSIDGTNARLGRLEDPFFASEFCHAKEKAGIPVYSMALTANRAFPLGSEDEDIRNKGIHIIRQALLLAEKTGIRVIHIAGYDELGEKCCVRTRHLFKDSLHKVLGFAAGFDVLLAVETMDAEFMGSCTNIRKLREELDTDRLFIYADIGNLTGMGHNVSRELAAGGDLIVGIHLKDARPGVMRDVPFGEGIVDFDKAFCSIKKLKYLHCMIAETWSYDDESFHPYLKKVSSFLRTKINSSI